MLVLTRRPGQDIILYDPKTDQNLAAVYSG